MAGASPPPILFSNAREKKVFLEQFKKIIQAAALFIQDRTDRFDFFAILVKLTDCKQSWFKPVSGTALSFLASPAFASF